MDILLIYPSVKTSDIESSVKIPPLGLAYIAAVLEKEGYNVRIFDYNVIDLFQHRSVTDSIGFRNPKIIGITCLTPFHSWILNFAKRAKELCDATIVVGGAHATALPETLLQSGDIDVVVKGEGEKAMLNLADAIIRRGEKPHNIIWQEKEYIQDLDSLPFPARHLLDLGRYSSPYIKEKLVTSILTSRGCPYNCTFCDYRFLMGNKFRRRSPENVIKEIEFCIKEYGIEHFSFRDSTFTFDSDWIAHFCDLIDASKLKFTWDCNGRVNLVTRFMLSNMKQIGCNLVSYGIESGNQQILDIVHKHTTLKQAEDAVKLTKKVGIEVTGYFILGLPTDTKETIQQTVDFAKKLNCDYTQFSLATPFPGTPLYDYAKEKGFIRDGIIWDDFSPIGQSIMRTEELDFEELEYALKQAYRRYYFRPAYVWNRFKKLNFKNIKQNWNGLRTLLRQQR